LWIVIAAIDLVIESDLLADTQLWPATLPTWFLPVAARMTPGVTAALTEMAVLARMLGGLAETQMFRFIYLLKTSYADELFVLGSHFPFH